MILIVFLIISLISTKTFLILINCQKWYLLLKKEYIIINKKNYDYEKNFKCFFKETFWGILRIFKIFWSVFLKKYLASASLENALNVFLKTLKYC